MAQLSSLQRLSKASHHTPVGVLVDRLPLLTSLSFCGRFTLLPSLPRATSLQRLHLSDYQHPGCTRAGLHVSTWELFNAALAPLVRLTELCLEFGATGIDLYCPAAPGLPHALTALTALAHFSWRGKPPDDRQLPSGAWLGALWRLELPAAVALASLPQLEAAPALESLTLHRCSASTLFCTHLPALLERLAAQPWPCSLHLQNVSPADMQSTDAAVAAAREAHPACTSPLMMPDLHCV